MRWWTVWFLIFGCICDRFDVLLDRSRKTVLSPGIHAMVPLDKTKHPSSTRKLGSKPSFFDIIVFYWPVDDAFKNIERGNVSSLFLRILHEISATVCIPVASQEVKFLIFT